VSTGRFVAKHPERRWTLVPSSQQTCCSLGFVKKFLTRNHKTALSATFHPPHSPQLVHMTSFFFPPTELKSCSSDVIMSQEMWQVMLWELQT
jgi:hypothetical protein